MDHLSRRQLVQLAPAIALGGAVPARASSRQQPLVLAYYYPGHSRDPRNDRWLGTGWTEWPMIANATPRFAGHAQPKRPLWGAFDEGDPRWAAREIALAADHAIDGFVFNDYWYDGQPFLNGALDNGFLKARGQRRLKFALMLTNYDWTDIFPAKADGPHRQFASGTLTPPQFAGWIDRLVTQYLPDDRYLRVGGALYVGFYDVGVLARGLGGIGALATALAALRARVAAAGLGRLHLNACTPGVAALASDGRTAGQGAAMLGLDSVTSYSWADDFAFPAGAFPTADYRHAATGAAAGWPRDAERFGVARLPTVAMGWDASARTQQDVPYRARGYPWLPILTGNTPAAYQRALIAARDFARATGAPAVMLNAWNEWSEGSYLLPERTTGTAYLAAVRHVFGKR